MNTPICIPVQWFEDIIIDNPHIANAFARTPDQGELMITAILEEIKVLKWLCFVHGKKDFEQYVLGRVC